MAGGFFVTDSDAGFQDVGQVGQTAPTTNITTDVTPGGFFIDEGASVDGGQNIIAQAGVARDAARDSQGWAVGDTDQPLDGWSATDNSKYYSEQAAASAAAARNIERITDSELREIRELRNEVDSDAIRADRAAKSADSDAANADSDAELARQEAVAAAQSEANALRYSQSAKADSESAREDARSAKADSESIADLEREIRVDSENIAVTAAKVDSDASSADSDAHRAELEGDVAQAYATGVGPLASYWATTDTDQGSHRIDGSLFNGTNRFFDLEGLGSERGINITGHTYIVYRNFVLVPPAEYTVIDDPTIAVNDHAHLDFFATSPNIPRSGDRLDIFLIPPGNRTYGPHSHPYISSEESALWQSEFIDNTVLRATVHDTEIVIAAGIGLTGGGQFTTNQANRETITISADSDTVVGVESAGNFTRFIYADSDTELVSSGATYSIEAEPGQIRLVGSLGDTDIIYTRSGSSINEVQRISWTGTRSNVVTSTDTEIITITLDSDFRSVPPLVNLDSDVGNTSLNVVSEGQTLVFQHTFTAAQKDALPQFGNIETTLRAFAFDIAEFSNLADTTAARNTFFTYGAGNTNNTDTDDLRTKLDTDNISSVNALIDGLVAGNDWASGTIGIANFQKVDSDTMNIAFRIKNSSVRYGYGINVGLNTPSQFTNTLPSSSNLFGAIFFNRKGDNASAHYQLGNGSNYQIINDTENPFQNSGTAWSFDPDVEHRVFNEEDVITDRVFSNDTELNADQALEEIARGITALGPSRRITWDSDIDSDSNGNRFITLNMGTRGNIETSFSIEANGGVNTTPTLTAMNGGGLFSVYRIVDHLNFFAGSVVGSVPDSDSEDVDSIATALANRLTMHRN